MAEARRTAGKTAAKAVRSAAETAAANGEVVEETVSDGAATLRGVSEKSGTLGMGFLATAVSLWSAAYAYSKFREALGKPVIPVPAPPTE